jgi:nucleoside-diphosphate-sugar epimerase
VLGDGGERRQFIYIDDQIEGIIRHLDYDGDLLNVVGPRPLDCRGRPFWSRYLAILAK